LAVFLLVRTRVGLNTEGRENQRRCGQKYECSERTHQYDLLRHEFEVNPGICLSDRDSRDSKQAARLLGGKVCLNRKRA
jgi:hypothetical protein